jgi:glutathione synthase/RimK-type ligase-like ATP-grasp enzyme
MQKTIAVASCAHAAGKEREDLCLIDELRRRGILAAHIPWDEPNVEWDEFELVIIRSTWDYPQRRDEFLNWADRLRHVLNAPAVLRWNTDKHYLNDLAIAGLPVIPTQFVEPGDSFEPPSIPFVIKPAISCGGVDTGRYDSDHAALACDHVRRLQAAGRTVMLQPYLASVENQGEVALIFIGGSFSHAVCRETILQRPGLRPKDEAIPLNITPYAATAAEREVAVRVMAHVAKQWPDLLYARIDLINGDDGRPLILEVELTEPSLFLEFCERGAERLAECIVAAAEQR